MARRPLLLLVALLAGCASEAPRERAARQAREGREAELARQDEPAPAPRSGVSAGGTRGPARRDLRPSLPTASPPPSEVVPTQTPPTAVAAEAEDDLPMETSSSDRLRRPLRSPAPSGDASRTSPDAAPVAPGAAPAPPGGDDLAAAGLDAAGLDAAERWLDDAERWLDGHPVVTARAERARVGRDLERLDADLDRQDAEVRQELAARNDERRAALAEVERRAADRDLRERDELRAKHEPPIGVVVIPADEWKIRYQRDLALLIPVQERRLAAERAIVEARQDKEARPLHEEKQAISRVRFRLAVLLRRIEEGT